MHILILEYIFKYRLVTLLLVSGEKKMLHDMNLMKNLNI